MCIKAIKIILLTCGKKLLIYRYLDEFLDKIRSNNIAYFFICLFYRQFYYSKFFLAFNKIITKKKKKKKHIADH